MVLDWQLQREKLLYCTVLASVPCWALLGVQQEILPAPFAQGLESRSVVFVKVWEGSVATLFSNGRDQSLGRCQGVSVFWVCSQGRPNHKTASFVIVSMCAQEPRMAHIDRDDLGDVSEVRCEFVGNKLDQTDIRARAEQIPR